MLINLGTQIKRISENLKEQFNERTKERLIFSEPNQTVFKLIWPGQIYKHHRRARFFKELF